MCADELERIPLVIIARWRIVERLARAYGVQAFLVHEPDINPEHYNGWEVAIEDEGILKMVWGCKNPRTYHKGLELAHAFLELTYGLGVTLDRAMVLGEVCISEGKLPSLAPIGG